MALAVPSPSIIVNVRCQAERPGSELRSYMTQTATAMPDPQRLRALVRANQVRLARAELKRRIASGAVSAAEVIRTCPAEADSWSVGELLMSQRRWGNSRCQRFLSHNQITE